MIYLLEFICGFSVTSFILYFLRGLRKDMALMLSSPTSNALTPTHPWVGKILVGRKAGSSIFESLNLESSERSACHRREENPGEEVSPRVTCQEESRSDEYIDGDVEATNPCGEEANDESAVAMIDEVRREEEIMPERIRNKLHQKRMKDKCSSGVLTRDQGSYSLEMMRLGGANGGALKLRKRPAKLVVPAYCADLEFGEMGRKLGNKEFEIEGRNFVLASKKGRRTVMEDGYGVMLDILGDPKQALFAVIDGHGGHAAADYVAENLGRNIVKALECAGEEDQAIRRGYLVTDEKFLSQGVSSGACAASVLIKDGELHAANVGDCRVVMSRKGLASALTNDHRPSREDERCRIENSGGFVHCWNGVWRVQGSLAVSRAIGDLHLKEWIVAEPEIKTLRLTSDCEFLIMASDGLWDKVSDQEAVDVVLREKNLLKSCKKLVDMSSSRGNIDDITVMVINLQSFVASRC